MQENLLPSRYAMDRWLRSGTPVFTFGHDFHIRSSVSDRRSSKLYCCLQWVNATTGSTRRLHLAFDLAVCRQTPHRSINHLVGESVSIKWLPHDKLDQVSSCLTCELCCASCTWSYSADLSTLFSFSSLCLYASLDCSPAVAV